MFYYPKYKGVPLDQDSYSFDLNHEKKRTRTLFTHDEDDLLRKLVEEFGDSDWSLIASNMNGRTVRQCRERWLNNLSSSVVKTKWTEKEDKILKQKYYQYGPKWKKLEQFFTGRTSYNIRNRWNSISKNRKQSNGYQKTEKTSHLNESNSSTKEKDACFEPNKELTSLNNNLTKQKHELSNFGGEKDTNSDIKISSNDEEDLFNEIFSGFFFSCDDNLYF